MPNSNFMSEANATAIFTAYATAIKLGLKAWIGTTAEWDQLTDAQKKQYQVNFKTDDCSEESIEVVKKSIADDFSINVNYDKGEYCYHLGDLYKFTSAHTAGAWSAADVEQVQVCDELNELKNTLNGQLDTISSGITIFRIGRYRLLSLKECISDTSGNIANLSEQDRPSSLNECLAFNNDGDAVCFVAISTSGAIAARTLAGVALTSNSIYGTISYYV